MLCYTGGLACEEVFCLLCYTGSLDLEEVFWLSCHTGSHDLEDEVLWLLCYTGTTVTETTSLSVKSYNLLSFPVNLLLQSCDSLRSYVRDAQCQKYLCSRKKTVFIYSSFTIEKRRCLC